MGVTNDETGTATRRTVLAGVGAVGVAATLAGCDPASDSGGPGAAGTPGGAGTPASAVPDGGGSAMKTADIPVGGGKVYEDQRIVVTQPTAGQFKAFTAVCTHARCLVNVVTDNVIHCPCHGSAYSAIDGTVKNPPATVGLKEYQNVTVANGSITVS
jgi:nitrite reductase/ring-hydroxylating ferredoxin subunit